MLIRDFNSFEQAERMNAFVFDKTGTVTTGKWALRQVIPLEPFVEQEVLAMAASLERDSDHYIAMEIKRQANENHMDPIEIERIGSFENGIIGQAGKEEVKLGSKEFLAKELETWRSMPMHDSVGDESKYSSVFMSFGGKPCAIFVFGDRIKEDASTAIQQLRSMGHRVTLISGDGDKTTKTIARKIGIEEAYGGRLPQEKASFVKDLQQEGYRVAVVGDGINDAPALVQANLAIAVHSGSHLGKEAGDITLMRGEPGQILPFLQLAKKVNKKVFQNLAWSFLYNLISIPVAMSGLLSPLIAVCAMFMSSLSVIGNTLLLTREGG